MPDDRSRLARRYRGLLFCYPHEYRRQRGEEIVDTMLELAPPGRSRPTARETLNLLAHGMRCRLGRPASRTVVAWAALAAVLCGLFTAAAGTWLAWDTARPLPSRADAARIFADALPGHDVGLDIYRDPARFVVYGEPLGVQHTDELLFGDGGGYQSGIVSAAVNGRPPIPQRRTLTTAQQRLRAAGWEVSEPIGEPAGEPDGTRFSARRGDTVLTIELYRRSAPDNTYLVAELRPAAPAAVWPMGIAGGLLGAVAGWLVFGWASRRTDGRHPALRRAASLLFGITMVLWCLPMVGAPRLLQHHLEEQHPSWHPLWEWLGQPAASLLFLVGAGSALLALGIAALPHRRPGPAPLAVDAQE